MNWYVCLTVSLLFIVLSAIAVIIKKLKNNRKYAVACLSLLCAGYIIYLPYFNSRYSVANALIANLFHLMQIVSLDADFFSVNEVCFSQVNNIVFAEIYSFAVAVIHIALPLLLLLSAINLLRFFLTEFSAWHICRKNNNFYVFSQFNEKSRLLAEDMKRNLKANGNFIIAASEKDAENASASLSGNNIVFTDKNIRDLSMKAGNKNIYYFNISDDEDKNINDTLALIEKYTAAPREVRSKIHIYAFSSFGEVLLDTTDKKNINVSVVNPKQAAVYGLFGGESLFLAPVGNKISLLIADFGDLGVETLKCALWCSQLLDVDWAINIVSENAVETTSYINHYYPRILTRGNINIYQADVTHTDFDNVLSKHCMESTHIIVAGNSDSQNIETAVFLRRFFLKNSSGFSSRPKIALKVTSHEKNISINNLKTLEHKRGNAVSYDFISFGNEKDLYSFDGILNSPFEKMAINVHLAYEDIFGSVGKMNLSESLGRYNRFETEKRSNRANALHIRYKLRHMAGLDLVPIDAEGDPVDFEQVIDDAMIERMAIAEHNRWVAFYESEGWEEATLEEVEKFKKAGLSGGQHKCSILKLHPYLCAYDTLPEYSEALGLGDARMYDAELIRRIPQIISDQWGAANKKYKLIRHKEDKNNGKERNEKVSASK